MFHKLILLSDGNVAYHGVPQKAYSFFVEALMNEFLKRDLILPQLEEHNPAGNNITCLIIYLYLTLLLLSILMLLNIIVVP